MGLSLEYLTILMKTFKEVLIFNFHHGSCDIEPD
jgi:hypothetical protein